MNNPHPSLKYQRLGIRTVIVIAIAVFLVKFGASTLNTSNTNWLFGLGFDNTDEYICWQYYRDSPLSFPVIGKIKGWEYPETQGIGLTQMIPLFAIPFRLISAWLPQNFQYFGWWFLLCYTLQAYFGYKLLQQLFGKSATLLNLILSTTFLITASALLNRTGHFALCAHFLILWALYLYFKEDTDTKRFKNQLTLVIVSALISQYMTAMVLGILFAQMWDLKWRKAINWGTYFLDWTCLLTAVLVIFYITGDFILPFTSMQEIGFGIFSANLNTFYNPLERCKFLPDLAVNGQGQHEGFAFLGTGILALLALALLGTLLSRKIKPTKQTTIKLIPLTLVTLFFFAWSLSDVITLNDKILIKYQIGNFFDPLVKAFRASGRFIWIPFYLITAATLTAFIKLKTRTDLKIIFLSAALYVQYQDMKPILNSTTVDHNKNFILNNVDKWIPIFGEADKIVMYPTYGWTYKNSVHDMYIFGEAAVLQHKPISLGYYARADVKVQQAFTSELNKTLKENTLGTFSNSIFLSDNKQRNAFAHWQKQDLVKAYTYDGMTIFVPYTLPKTIQYLTTLQDCQPINLATTTTQDSIPIQK
jgi:hypothetical protein